MVAFSATFIGASLPWTFWCKDIYHLDPLLRESRGHSLPSYRELRLACNYRSTLSWILRGHGLPSPWSWPLIPSVYLFCIEGGRSDEVRFSWDHGWVVSWMRSCGSTSFTSSRWASLLVVLALAFSTTSCPASPLNMRILVYLYWGSRRLCSNASSSTGRSSCTYFVHAFLS